MVLADEAWAIRVSSAIGCVERGKLGCKGKVFDCKAARAAEDGLEARRARQGRERATRGGQGGTEGVTWSNSAQKLATVTARQQCIPFNIYSKL